MATRKIEKILIVRTDRLGDVLLTTPVGTALRHRFPQAKVFWLVKPYSAPLLDNNPEVDGVILDRGQPLSALIKEVEQEAFDVAVVAYPRWRAAWACFRAGIPLRIGPSSKWYSLLFNNRIWQHRSQGLKHEADYNLELLEPLGIPLQRYSTSLVLTNDERSSARQVLTGHRLTFQKPLVVIHPGSGGSSARWPLRFFIELGDRLQEDGCDLVVTSGPGENYQSVMIDQMRRIPVFIAGGSVNLREFAALLSCADLVVSNSTGPLHMAVALGVPTVSMFSPLATCHPRRWGPYPSWPEMRPEHAVALAPDEGSPDTDMAKISVEEVLRLCRQRLAEHARVSRGKT